MKEPTTKQLDILDYIKKYQEQHKVMPTLTELGSQLGISISGAQQRIDALIRKGYLERKNIYIIRK